MIEEKLYNKIVEVIPIICVDAFIFFNKKILLLKRNNEPAYQQWWVPGGRLQKNELLVEGILRKVEDETSLKIEEVNQVGITETIFENKHTINICFRAESLSDKVILNSEHSEYKWFDLEELPNDLNSELLKIIKIIKYDWSN